MATTIGQRELRDDTARVIDAVAAGETFVATRNGDPLAELRRIRARRRAFVARRNRRPGRRGCAYRRGRFRAGMDAIVDQGV